MLIVVVLSGSVFQNLIRSVLHVSCRLLLDIPSATNHNSKTLDIVLYVVYPFQPSLYYDAYNFIHDEHVHCLYEHYIYVL